MSKMAKELERIIPLLEEAGIEKRQWRRALESIAGCSYSAVSQWFNGDTKNIEYKHLVKIGKKFNKSVEYLKGEADDSSKEDEATVRLNALWSSYTDEQKEKALRLLRAAID